MTQVPLRVMIVIGTRPEAIKLMPVIVEARARPDDFIVTTVRTGQHRDLVDDLMIEFGLEADVDLDVMEHDQSLAAVMADCVRGLSMTIARERPDWVIVQGDTTTTFAGALAAFYNQVLVAHVEAGLRTNDRRDPFPEELNRSMTARLADLHFAPTEAARANLRREGVADEAIVVTGNTVVDALKLTIARPGDAVSRTMPDERYVLVTVHRRENHGDALHRICDGLTRLLVRQPLLTLRIPMHPHPRVRETLVERLGSHPRVALTDALGHRDFVHALNGAALVLTDSGGVQEECAVLGKPVLVLRADTERPEVVAEGIGVVVGTDGTRIVDAACALLDDDVRYAAMAHRSTAFGDGDATRLILDALLAHSGPQRRCQGTATPE